MLWPQYENKISFNAIGIWLSDENWNALRMWKFQEKPFITFIRRKTFYLSLLYLRLGKSNHSTNKIVSKERCYRQISLFHILNMWRAHTVATWMQSSLFCSHLFPSIMECMKFTMEFVDLSAPENVLLCDTIQNIYVFSLLRKQALNSHEIDGKNNGITYRDVQATPRNPLTSASVSARSWRECMALFHTHLCLSRTFLCKRETYIQVLDFPFHNRLPKIFLVEGNLNSLHYDGF